MMKFSYDVLIIGAGAAGLACALELDKMPLRYLMLEGRSRIGGRVSTSLPDSGAPPVELGAEFIHGSATTTLFWMHKLQLSFYDVSDEHLFLQSKKLSDIPNYFEHLDEMMPKKSSFQKRDPSVGSYLEHKKASPKWKKMFGAFVEGFHGADLNQIGVQGLLTTQLTDEPTLNGAQMFRQVQGYDQLIHGMHRYLRQSESLTLNTPVRRIEWSKGLVKVYAYSSLTRKEEVFMARRLVVTVPIEVLRSDITSSKIEWSPRPKNL